MKTSSAVRKRTKPAGEVLVAAPPLSDCPHRPGRLILVMCSDAALLDLTLRAVRRRFADRHAVSFVEPVGTHAQPAGGGVRITRNEFAAAERIGGLALAWRRGGRACGHSMSLVARLEDGETVVAGVDADVASDARALWPDVRVIRLGARTDRARAALSPRACLLRMTRSHGDRNAMPRAILRERIDAVVHDDGDARATIERLTAALASQLPLPEWREPVAVSVPSLVAPARQPRASRGRRPRVPSNGGVPVLA